MTEQQPQTAEPTLAPGDPAEDPVAFAIAAARIAADNRSEELAVLDVRGVSSLADVFVIGTGTSDRQMSAVMDRIRDYGREIGRRPFRSTDPREGKWVIADYVDVVIHLFDAEHRDFYDLESLWGDARPIRWQRPEDLPTAGEQPGGDDAQLGENEE